MPEEQMNGSSESSVKKAEFGFGGILIGVAFVAALLFTLNYFNIINLPVNLPQKQMRQQQTQAPQSQSDLLAISARINPVLEAKAEKAGYYIIWQGDSNDTTGRTILASKERIKDRGFPDQFGYLNYQTAAIGLFKSFEKIPSGNDYYMTLENPINQQQIKIRISTSVPTLDGSAPEFAIDNLDTVRSTNSGFFEKLFDFSGLDKDLEKIQKIIKQGDVIYAGLHTVLIVDKGEIKDAKISKDENGIIYADGIVLRRFGGSIQIAKELTL